MLTNKDVQMLTGGSDATVDVKLNVVCNGGEQQVKLDNDFS